MKAPKPGARAGRVSLWRYARMFRRDILSAQPEHLYRAWMAEFRTPFFRSFLVNDPALLRTILKDRPSDFPKSPRVTAGLAPLLGRSVFVTNGAEWERQRRIIDPAFEGGQVRAVFPQMLSAAEEASKRISPGPLELEAWASHVTADIIFRTLFSRSIDDALAAETYHAFRAFQRAQPVLTPAALFPSLPALLPRRARKAAARLRDLITELVDRRMSEIASGAAPDDLATRILSTADPETGDVFSPEEMVDQVAIFFLAGHETSASLLSWALWLAAASGWQERLAAEAEVFREAPEIGTLSRLPQTRNVIRETLRLYPPVPMMVREAAHSETFRKRAVRAGSQIVLSPWHLHRHERLWDRPDEFDPDRWSGETPKDAYMPFSAGQRVCPGASFALTEAAVVIATVLAEWQFEAEGVPKPVAHLTVRAEDGIRVRATRR